MPEICELCRKARAALELTCELSAMEKTRDIAAARACGGMCVWKAPRLTEVSSVKPDTFPMYAVRGFRAEYVPGALQDDKTNQDVQESLRKIKAVREYLVPALSGYTEKAMATAKCHADLLLSSFKDLYWCDGRPRCHSTCWCSFPAAYRAMLTPGFQPKLEAAAIAMLEDFYWAWLAQNADELCEKTSAFPERALPVCKSGSDAPIAILAWEVPAREDNVSSVPPAISPSPGHEIVEIAGKSKTWTRHGKLHREDDLPARIEYTCRRTTLSYFRDGIPFRSAKTLPHVWHQLKKVPCVCEKVVLSSVCECGAQESADQYVWLDEQEKPHREDDLPAVIGPGRFKQWYLHGKLHREKSRGPAQITEEGNVSFYEKDAFLY